MIRHWVGVQTACHDEDSGSDEAPGEAPHAVLARLSSMSLSGRTCTVHSSTVPVEMIPETTDSPLRDR